MSTPSHPKTLNPNPSESWIIVSHRRQSKRKSTPKPLPVDSAAETLIPNPTPWSPGDDAETTTADLKPKLLSRIRSSLRRLKSSHFYSRFLAQLQSPELQSALGRLGPKFELIVYGIGSVESYDTPRLQLALALLLHEQLRPQISSVQVFDPVITTTECAVLEELGVAVMRMDERGRRQVKVPTLFFMPHCEVQLYDNLLGANWGHEGLSKTVILGNSFREYKAYVGWKKSATVKVEEAGRRVLHSVRFVREVAVEVVENSGDDDDGFFSAFHDINWHFFDVSVDTDMSIL